jgi:hypothetical protein
LVLEGILPAAREAIESPVIDTSHILYGTITPNGKAVGCHRREGIECGGARVTKKLAGPDFRGVYAVTLEILDKRNARWIRKNRISTIFPNAWSREQVLLEIEEAFANCDKAESNYWEGLSCSGLRIGGYYRRGVIRTAFPIIGCA